MKACHHKLWFSDTDTEPFGCSVIVATTPAMPLPVGHLWYRDVAGNQIDMMDIYTNSYCRRTGIATALLRKLRRDNPEVTIITRRSNSDSEPWLIRCGFVKEDDCWRLRPEEPSPMI